jgi:hypothetical protein
MLMRSLLQCRACRLTWFPQGGAAAACPACGGTKVGGTLELFHAGVALIVFGLIGWFLRHGAIAGLPGMTLPTVAETKQPAVTVERSNLVSAPPKKSQVYVPARKNQVYVSSKKIKPTKVKVKRRQKKAKTRSKHVQR